MRHAGYFVLASSMILLLSGTLANAQVIRSPTEISIDISARSVHVNDTVMFSGTIVSADTGEGIQGKTITIYRDGPIIPIPIAQTITGIDGDYEVEWTASLEHHKGRPITVFAQFDGDAGFLPSRTGKVSFDVKMKPLELFITTDGNKNRYFVGDRAFISVAFADGSANFVDPDFLRATYDSQFIEMKREDIGRYTFETPPLVKFEQHQFGVFALKAGFKSAQESTTITVFGVREYDPMKVTATMRGDTVKINVRNNQFSPDNVFRFTGTFVGGAPMSGTADKWQFERGSTGGEFIFKPLEGFLPPGKSVTLSVKVEGQPTTLIWKAFDLYGKEHSTVRDVTGSGTAKITKVRSQ